MKKPAHPKGQVIIVILLILVVVLTVGLSIATRTVTDIKLSQQTELSQRAFNAAEAGIESVLSGQSSGTSGSYVAIGSGSTAPSYNVSVQTVGGTSDAFVFNKPIAKDDTQQIWFVAHNSDNSLNLSDPTNFNSNSVYVYWGNPGQSSNSSSSPITPALEVTLVYKDAVGFKIAKDVYDPNVNRIPTNNFNSSSIDTAGNYTLSKLQFRRQIDFSQAPFSVSGIGTTSTLYALRLRLLYNDTDQMLGAQPASGSFPIQGRLISSTGNAGEVYRKVEVFESFPVLPPIFDYVIFNGSSNTLGK